MARPRRSEFGLCLKVIGVRLSQSELRELDAAAGFVDAKTPSELVRKLALEGARALRAQASAAVQIPPTTYVVGCGDAKAGLGPDVRIEARRLYCSELFRKSFDVARELAEGDIWIASAKYGAIRPETEITPYDKRLTKAEAAEWAAKVAEQAAGGRPAGRAVLLMGEEYAAPLRAAFKRIGWVVKEPMKGLKIGQRLSWLNGELARLGVSSAPL